MEKIRINKLGPIDFCELEIRDFMIFTGPQASGKSTISKSIFFFKNIKRLLVQLLSRRLFLESDVSTMPLKYQLMREIRACFLQTFGTTWCMNKEMSLEYYYSEDIYIQIFLKTDEMKANFIWSEFSETLEMKLDALWKDVRDEDKEVYQDYSTRINAIFHEDAEIIYIPAGRSMMTLFSTQLMFLYSVMNDEQKRSLDYCTQNYLERILQIKSYFVESPENLMRAELPVMGKKDKKVTIELCVDLMRRILQGEYVNINGEERLRVSDDRYVKINFASSGQQEAMWILNVVFYYLMNNRKSYFIIEEPESHLYPNAQKLMAEFISLAKTDENKVLLTTHSPYILGTINNLLYADKLSRDVDSKKIRDIIHSNKWLEFNEISAFHIDKGIPKSCLDNEFESIDNAVIDGASDEINEDYEKMVMLRDM